MSNFSSPFAGLMLSDSSEDATPNSLLDLINSHNTIDSSYADDDVSSLSELTSKFLNVDKNSSTGKNESLLPSFGSLSVVGNANDHESDECNTLEAYTKSFLNSKETSVSPFRKPPPPPNFSGRIPKTQTDPDVKQIDEKLRNIHVGGPDKEETRKIDLTAALTNRTKTNSISFSTEVAVETKQSVFSYPVEECNIDLSSLADDNLLYSSMSLSPFGYVVSKQWKRIIFPKKYRKLGKIRPYNIAKSFKFDTPSPDECTLKSRTRNTSVGEP